MCNTVTTVSGTGGVCACLLAPVMSNAATPWTVACQAPLCMRFNSGQEYWSREPFPSPGGSS